MQKLNFSANLQKQAYEIVRHLRENDAAKCVVIGEEAKRAHGYKYTHDYGIELVLDPRDRGFAAKILSGYETQPLYDSIIVNADQKPIRLNFKKKVYGVETKDIIWGSVAMPVNLGVRDGEQASANIADPLHIAIMEYLKMMSNPLFEKEATDYIFNYINRALRVNAIYMERGMEFLRLNHVALIRYMDGEAMKGFSDMLLRHFSS